MGMDMGMGMDITTKMKKSKVLVTGTAGFIGFHLAKFHEKKGDKLFLLDNFFYENISKKNFLCLKDNYLLVELSYYQPPVNLFEILFELQVNGFIPVLAHPERYSFFYSNFNEYIKLKKIGVEFQLNLLSTVDYYGNDVRKISDKLLKNNMIDYVGTDIHTKEHISSIKNSILKISEISKLKEAIENNSKFI